jgi:LytS/YehU family sensor histidine kinase
LAFLDRYLAIQKIRFGDRLQIEMRISPEVQFAAVPSLFIQPLVENAIRHGISSRSSGGSVIVSAERAAEQLRIRVIDDGVGLPPRWTLERCAGLGLSVTRDRITGLHPDGASYFAIRPRAGGGTEAEVRLPLRLNGEDGNGHSPA